jgi:hypothetical protein
MTSIFGAKQELRAKAIAYSLSLIIEDASESGIDEKLIASVLGELTKLEIYSKDIAEVEHFLRRTMANNT